MTTALLPKVWTRPLALPANADNSQYAPLLSNLGALGVSQITPKYLALAQNGLVYGISAGVVANAKIPIVDVGTTTAAWALYNGNATGNGGYALHVLRVGVWLASGTSDIGFSLIAGMSTAVQASAVTNATGIVGPKSLSSSASQRTSLATLGGAVTLAGAPSWVPLGSGNHHAAVATVGTGLVAEVDGGIVIPPGFACGFTVLAGVGTTAKFAVSVIYAEIPSYLV